MRAGQKRPRPESSTDDVDDSSGPGGSSASNMSIFRPPILRSAVLSAATSLNKALFTKSFEIAAARVHDNRLIAKYQKALTKSRELLKVERLASVVDVPEASTAAAAAPGQGSATSPPKSKCILLQPDVLPSAPETWSNVIRQGVERDELGVFPYTLTLDYHHWTSREVLVAVLPEEFHDDIPTGFNTAGHVAHLNLRGRFMPYKYVVAQVLLDKNPQLRTVINKTDLVGTESAFRTFPYEVLAGPDDLDVEVRENLCTYRFDYGKVYWNSKLEPEHTRLLYLFKPGEVVVDVMAGIGPFAVPAGKRGVFVWANDMNPDSYEGLCDAIQRNKVPSYVRPFNEDGAVFIKQSADLVRKAAEASEAALSVSITAPSKKGAGGGPSPAPAPMDNAFNTSPDARGKKQSPRQKIFVPPTISHFVMNLPASAITFLPHFRGLYAGHEDLFRLAPGAKEQAAEEASGSEKSYPRLPIIHTHCFAAKSEEGEVVPEDDVCARVSSELGVQMALCNRYADVEQDDPLASDPKHLVYVHYVRAVAPHKAMFCASFRLPASVAFAPRAE